jgi:hypothetical protein
MDNRDRHRRHRGLPPTAWQAQPIRGSAEASEPTIAELIALVRETGGTVGGYGLWDPRHEDEVRRMLTTALETEGVLPPGSVAKLSR